MTDDKVGINFVNIPIEIFGNNELTANEKILYGYLSIFKKQCCFQSNEALAEAIGVNEKTITNALKHLEELEYIFVEFVNGNSAARRIYVIFDNPKKMKFLISKGYLLNSDFPQVFAQGSKNCAGGSKFCEGGSKNCAPQNRGEGSKNCDHKIIKYNKNIESHDSTEEMSNRASNKKTIGRNELLRLEYAI